MNCRGDIEVFSLRVLQRKGRRMAMDYMTAKEAAGPWGISQRQVAILCGEGRIPNAQMINHVWHIPKDAVKPNAGGLKKP